MTIYGITAKDTELAGAGLAAFLGFFDRRFRDHDYDVGRSHARNALNALIALIAPELQQAGSIGPIRYISKKINDIDSRLDGLKMCQVPQKELVAFKAGMRKRLNQLLREMWGPILSLPAIPGSDLILDSLLDRLIAKF